MSANSPHSLSVTVFPPVFGPDIIITLNSAQSYRHGDDFFAVDERMPALFDVYLSVVGISGHDRFRVARIAGFGEDDVERRDRRAGTLDVFALAADLMSERLQYPLALRALLRFQGADLVVHLHERIRLDIDRRAARRPVMQQSGHGRAAFRLHGQNISALAHGDEIFHQKLRLRARQKGVQPAPHRRSRRLDRGAQTAQFARRLVGKFALLRDGVKDMFFERSVRPYQGRNFAYMFDTVVRNIVDRARAKPSRAHGDAHSPDLEGGKSGHFFRRVETGGNVVEGKFGRNDVLVKYYIRFARLLQKQARGVKRALRAQRKHGVCGAGSVAIAGSARKHLVEFERDDTPFSVHLTPLNRCPLVTAPSGAPPSL